MGLARNLCFDRIDCVKQLSKCVGSFMPVRKLRSYCVYKCKGKVSEDVVRGIHSTSKWRKVCKDMGMTIEHASSEL